MNALVPIIKNKFCKCSVLCTVAEEQKNGRTNQSFVFQQIFNLENYSEAKCNKHGLSEFLF